MLALWLGWVTTLFRVGNLAQLVRALGLFHLKNKGGGEGRNKNKITGGGRGESKIN